MTFRKDVILREPSQQTCTDPTKSNRRLFEDERRLRVRCEMRSWALGSTAAPVEWYARQSRYFDLTKTARVDRGSGCPGRTDSKPERCATAVGAEVMLNDVLVESIGRQVSFGRSEPKLFARHEPQQEAFSTAVSAIAFHSLLKLPVDFKRNASAMATAFVDHGAIPAGNIIDSIIFASSLVSSTGPRPLKAAAHSRPVWS